MTGRWLVAQVLVAGLLVSACGGTDVPPVSTPSPSTPLASTPLASSSPPVSRSASPSLVTAGADAVRDCGTFMLDQGEEIDPAAYRCLIRAVAKKQPALLVITQPTTEGDPVPVTYVVDASGSVEVSTDSSQDRFTGDPGIQTQTCTGPSVKDGALTFASCSQRA